MITKVRDRTVILKYLLTLLLCSCAGIGFAKDYFVSTSGNNKNPGTESQPWKSLLHACRSVSSNQGHRIILGEGTFTESGQCILPEGVSLMGQGTEKTRLKGASALWTYEFSGYQFEKYLILVKGGKQRLHKFSIEGDNKKLHGGILIQDAAQVELDELDFSAIFYNSVWIWNSSYVTFHDSQIYDCSWGSSDWAGGAVHVGAVSDVELCELQIEEIEQRKGNRGGGLGIKVLGPEGHAVERLIIRDCNIQVADFGLWQNNKAPNISIEFHNVLVKDCEVRKCTLNNTLSLVADVGSEEPGNMRVLNNQIICSGPASYPVELSMHYVEVAYNDITPGNGGYVIVNWENKGVKYVNWNIHHNQIESVASGWPSSVVCSRGGLDNLNFHHNRISLSGPPVAIVAAYGSNESTGLRIWENEIVRKGKKKMETEPSRDWIVYSSQKEGVHLVKNVRILNNSLEGFAKEVSQFVEMD